MTEKQSAALTIGLPLVWAALYAVFLRDSINAVTAVAIGVLIAGVILGGAFVATRQEKRSRVPPR